MNTVNHTQITTGQLAQSRHRYKNPTITTRTLAIQEATTSHLHPMLQSTTPSSTTPMPILTAPNETLKTTTHTQPTILRITRQAPPTNNPTSNPAVFTAKVTQLWAHLTQAKTLSQAIADTLQRQKTSPPSASASTKCARTPARRTAAGTQAM